MVRSFGLDETHGIALRPTTKLAADSGALGWTSAFASLQHEEPYQDNFTARPDHLIILHLDGFVKVDRWLGAARVSRMIAPGGMFMIPGGMDFSVRLGNPLSTVHLYVRRAILRDVAQDIAAGDPDRLELVPRIGETDPLLERLVIGVRDELLDPDPLGEAYVDHLVRTVAARLIRRHSVGTIRAPAGHPLPGDINRKIIRATDYVNAYIQRTIRLDELAREMGISVAQLTGLFKRTLGLPPHRFIMNLRVTRARELLQTTQLSISEIALACGFSHQEHLTRIFKRETGFTPAAYRRNFA